MFLCSWILLLHLQGVLNCPGGSEPEPPATTAPPTTTVAPGGWGTVNGCRHRPSPQDEIRVNKVCEDCYNVFRDHDIYVLCRWPKTWYQLV